MSVCWKLGSGALAHQNLSGNLKASLLVSGLCAGNVWSSFAIQQIVIFHLTCVTTFEFFETPAILALATY